MKEGDTLVVDTHAVKLTFTPQAADELALEFSGDMFKKPVTIGAEARRTRHGYADAAAAYGLIAIRRGLGMWKAGGGKKYPPAKRGHAVGHAGQDDPLAHQHVHRPADAARQGQGRLRLRPDWTAARSYSLVAYLSDGSTIGK